VKTKTIIEDLSDPLRQTADVLRTLGDQLLSLRRAASQLRASDQMGVTARASAALSEALSHAHARIIEARAHVALANKAAANVLSHSQEKMRAADPKDVS
jgi:hypothetical protein